MATFNLRLGVMNFKVKHIQSDKDLIVQAKEKLK